MFAESITYVTGNILCALTRCLWEWSIGTQTQIFPNSFKYVTGSIVGPYAILGRGISFLRPKCLSYAVGVSPLLMFCPFAHAFAHVCPSLVA